MFTFLLVYFMTLRFTSWLSDSLRVASCFLMVNAFALDFVDFRFTSFSTLNAQETVQYDLLLKGGHVIDPANNRNGIMDVAIADGKIARVANNISPANAKRNVDVSGYYVTPGLIDIHGHVFQTFDQPGRWTIADHHCFQSGVTTVVDAGTSGAENFEDFKKITDNSQTRILAFLNIAAPGKNESQNEPSNFKVSLAVATAKKYPDIIVGFKTCDYWGGDKPFDDVHTPWASVDSTIAAGRMAGLPVMVSFTTKKASGGYPPRSYRELILKKMRSGDIHTCVFSPYIPIVMEDGTINPDLIEARKRGVIFDSTHGASSFLYRNAVPAITQGFLPDTIGTDLHGRGRMRNVVDMFNVMSKHLCIGMSLEDVIRCTTVSPACAIKRPELGSLSVGSTADIAVIELLNGTFSYLDASDGKIIGDKKLQIGMTLFGGNIVYNPYGIGKAEWTNIPEDSNYWENPSGQNY